MKVKFEMYDPLTNDSKHAGKFILNLFLVENGHSIDVGEKSNVIHTKDNRTILVTHPDVEVKYQPNARLSRFRKKTLNPKDLEKFSIDDLLETGRLDQNMHDALVMRCDRKGCREPARFKSFGPAKYGIGQSSFGHTYYFCSKEHASYTDKIENVPNPMVMCHTSSFSWKSVSTIIEKAPVEA